MMTKQTKEMVMNEVTTGEALEKGGYFVGYNYVIRNAIEVFQLTLGEYSCLMMLFSYAGADKDTCFPGQKTLANHLQITVRTVHRQLDGLLAKGVIHIYNRQNKYNMKVTNIYDLSPCLQKIREIFCKDVYSELVQDEMKIVQKTRKIGPDTDVSTETTDMTSVSGGSRHRCHTTNNNIQITNNKEDEDIPNASLSDEIIQHDLHNEYTEQEKIHAPTLTDDDLMEITDRVKNMYKDKLQKRSFDSVLKKCMNNYKKGTVPNYENYLITAIENKMQDLELRKKREKSLLDLLPKIKHKKNKRTEMVPDWVKEQKQDNTSVGQAVSREAQENDKNEQQKIEDERRRLNEILAKYKKE